MDPDKLLQCPFDKNHQIRVCRFPYHLIKCRKVSLLQLIVKTGYGKDQGLHHCRMLLFSLLNWKNVFSYSDMSALFFYIYTIVLFKYFSLRREKYILKFCRKAW